MKVPSLHKLAEILGVSHTLVNRYARDKVIRKTSKGYDVEECRANIQARISPSRAKVFRGNEGHEVDFAEIYNKARAKNEVLKMERADMENKKMKGELLDRDEVQTAWRGMITAAKNSLLSIPDELGDTLASEYNPIRCRERMRDRIEQALTELSDYPRTA